MRIPEFFGDEDGDKAWGWLIQLDQFFQKEGIKEDQKYIVTVRGLRGSAYNWYMDWKWSNLAANRRKFEKAFIEKYIPDLWVVDKEEESEHPAPEKERREEEIASVVEGEYRNSKKKAKENGEEKKRSAEEIEKEIKDEGEAAENAERTKIVEEEEGTVTKQAVEKGEEIEGDTDIARIKEDKEEDEVQPDKGEERKNNEDAKQIKEEAKEENAEAKMEKEEDDEEGAEHAEAKMEKEEDDEEGAEHAHVEQGRETRNAHVEFHQFAETAGIFSANSSNEISGSGARGGPTQNFLLHGPDMAGVQTLNNTHPNISHMNGTALTHNWANNGEWENRPNSVSEDSKACYECLAIYMTNELSMWSRCFKQWDPGGCFLTLSSSFTLRTR